jgi:hypothetical protein
MQVLLIGAVRTVAKVYKLAKNVPTHCGRLKVSRNIFLRRKKNTETARNLAE